VHLVAAGQCALCLRRAPATHLKMLKLKVSVGRSKGYAANRFLAMNHTCVCACVRVVRACMCVCAFARVHDDLCRDSFPALATRAAGEPHTHRIQLLILLLHANEPLPHSSEQRAPCARASRVWAQQ